MASEGQSGASGVSHYLDNSDFVAGSNDASVAQSFIRGFS